MATYFWDPINGVDTNSGLTAALPKKTFSAANTLASAAGDIVKVKSPAAPMVVAGVSSAYWADLAKFVHVAFTGGGIGTQRATDNFTGAAGSSLNARTSSDAGTWAANTVAGYINTGISISDANRIMPVGAPSALYHTTSGTAADVIVRGTFYPLSFATGIHSLTLMARMTSTSTATFYSCRYVVSTSRWELFSVVAGTSTSLGTFTQALTIGNSYVVELRCIGSKIQVFVDGVPVITVQNTSITGAGYAGISTFTSTTSATNTTGIHLDDWFAFNVLAVSSSMPVQMVDDCSTLWTAGAQGSAGTIDTGSFKKGSTTAIGTYRVTNAAAVGQIAYRALGSARDFSSYQNISFWIRVSVAHTAGSKLSLLLCSDVAGTTAVNTIQIPAITAINAWTLITIATGGNLGASIQSISLNATTAITSSSIYIDSIIVSKNTAGNINLSSLISKGTANETYYGIGSMTNIDSSGCLMWLDQKPEARGDQTRGYASLSYPTGVNYSGSLYKVDPIRWSEQHGQAFITGNTNAVFSPSTSGADNSPITWDFGYTDLTLLNPDTETWMDLQNGNGDLFVLNSGRSNIVIKGINLTRGNRFFSASGNGRGLDFTFSANNTSGGALSVAQTYRSKFYIKAANNCSSSGISADSSSGTITWRVGQANNNIGNAIRLQNFEVWSGGEDGYIWMINNFSAAISAQAQGNVIKNALSRANANFVTSSGSPNANRESPNLLEDCLWQEAVASNSVNYLDMRWLSNNNGFVGGTPTLISDNVQWTAIADANRNTLSGYAWKCYIVSATIRTSFYPADFLLGKVVCMANRTVSITAYLKRDNASITTQLLVIGGQLNGVDNDVVATITSTNVYDKLTITFTPTEPGLIDLIWRTYTTVALTSSWIDDIIILGGANPYEINTLDVTGRHGLYLSNSLQPRMLRIGNEGGF